MSDRRTFLKLLGGAACAGAAGIVAAPVGTAFLSPIAKDSMSGTTGFIGTVSAEAVPADGTPVAVTIVAPRPRDAWAVMPPSEVGTVFLLRRGGELAAFSAICPHLGCKVDADNARGCFRCPCHDSDFALDGAVLTGPSPRGLDPLKTRVVNGLVEVEYLRFKTGTPARVLA